MKAVSKTDRFAFFDNTRFMTSIYCKAHYHANYEMERRQYTPLLPVISVHMEWLWLLTIDTKTDFWLAVERLKRQATTDQQCHTLAKPSKYYLEGLGHTLFPFFEIACKEVFPTFNFASDAPE